MNLMPTVLVELADVGANLHLKDSLLGWFSPEWTARLGFNEAIWCKLYDLKSMLASLFHL